MSPLVAADQLVKQVDTEFLSHALCRCNVLLILRLVLDLVLDAFKNAHGSAVIVDASGRLEGRGHDLLIGDQIIGEAVVQASLQFKEVVYTVKEFRVCSVPSWLSAWVVRNRIGMGACSVR